MGTVSLTAVTVSAPGDWSEVFDIFGSVLKLKTMK